MGYVPENVGGGGGGMSSSGVGAGYSVAGAAGGILGSAMAARRRRREQELWARIEAAQEHNRQLVENPNFAEHAVRDRRFAGSLTPDSFSDVKGMFGGGSSRLNPFEIAMKMRGGEGDSFMSDLRQTTGEDIERPEYDGKDLAASDTGDKVGGAAAGALSGVGTGATVGSVVPGVGTAVGAGVGALVGGIRGWLANRHRKQDERTADAAMQTQQNRHLVENPNFVENAVRDRRFMGSIGPEAFKEEFGTNGTSYGMRLDPMAIAAAMEAGGGGDTFMADMRNTQLSDIERPDYTPPKQGGSFLGDLGLAAAGAAPGAISAYGSRRKPAPDSTQPPVFDEDEG